MTWKNKLNINKVGRLPKQPISMVHQTAHWHGPSAQPKGLIRHDYINIISLFLLKLSSSIDNLDHKYSKYWIN